MNQPTMQSALDAASGSAAAHIHELGMTLYVGGALILIAVLAIAVYGVFGAPRRIAERRWLVLGGLAFPVATLAALFAYALAIGHSIDEHATADALRIKVTGKQWWWEVQYEQAGSPDIVLANEIRVPVGRTVEITLLSHDVIHSFWVPSLAGKVDMIPGRINRLVLRADRPGTFRGQCAEYCGAQHALMALHVFAEPEPRFERWLQRQAQPTRIPADPSFKRGYDLFFRGGCDTCHAVRGTPAAGRLGPDLTHVGSRHALAAGTLGNHIGTMAGWIAGAQSLKPGNLMPDTAYTGPELLALSAWLGSLQ